MLHAVIMAGGRGTRFWPASRETRPKQFLAITGEKSLLQQTVDRILPLIPPEHIIVVTGEVCREETCRHLPELPAENIIAEPLGRNTAPCIGLAALFIRKKNPRGIMVVLPADHAVTNEDAFRGVITRAAAAAEPSLVTIGIRPSLPETGFGYIERGEPAALSTDADIYRVAAFREKPDAETARSFLEKGTFYWNSGIFVWTIPVIMDAIAGNLPDLYGELLALEPTLGTDGEAAAIRAAYERISPVSIDYGVMEKTPNVLIVTGDFGWNDLGSWDALAELAPKDERGNVLRGTVVAVDTNNALVLGRGKLIALVGVEDIVVVEQDDAILVLKRGKSQDVRKVVDHLEHNDLKRFL